MRRLNHEIYNRASIARRRFVSLDASHNEPVKDFGDRMPRCLAPFKDTPFIPDERLTKGADATRKPTGFE